MRSSTRYNGIKINPHPVSVLPGESDPSYVRLEVAINALDLSVRILPLYLVHWVFQYLGSVHVVFQQHHLGSWSARNPCRPLTDIIGGTFKNVPASRRSRLISCTRRKYQFRNIRLQALYETYDQYQSRIPPAIQPAWVQDGFVPQPAIVEALGAEL